MSEPSFDNAGQKPGLELWRIENMAPVKMPEVSGAFHTGDAYILLSTTQKGDSKGLEWAVHFWLGAESSQDERGVAAIKSVELDDSLGGAATQYREVEGKESPLFLSYFKQSGIQYLPGGVASGFHKVEKDVYRTRLLHVKGSRVVRSKEVPLTSASLNTGDVFILDAGLKLYLYNGAEAHRAEKAKGVELINRIRDGERGGRAEVVIVNEDPDNADFWEALGGKITVTQKGAADDEVESGKQWTPVLIKISDANGSLESVKINLPECKLRRDCLDPKDVFLVDCGNEVYVWVGKDATSPEKKGCMGLATQYVKESGRSEDSTRIMRVVQGAETAVFKSLFYQWEPPRVVDFGFKGSKGVAVSPRSQDAVDVASMLERVRAEEGISADEGTGDIKVWRIEDLKKADVPKESYGQFYAGDCYIVLYTYKKSGKDQSIIYFWQGNASSADEKGASALLTVELDNELKGAATQVRVVQGKEPAHFRQLFKGKMVVHSGGKASGFKNRSEEDSTASTGPRLYQVKGSSAENTYAVQLPASAASLNSGDCFVLCAADGSVYSWLGSGSNVDEKETATATAENLSGGNAVSSLEEGAESDGFWEALGGKGDYPKSKGGEELPKEARLFQLSNATGSVRVDEVSNFAQVDLVDEDVMLLDTFTSVFVWVGSHANEVEKAQALKVAQEYIDKVKDGRDKATPIVRVASGNESELFTQHFTGWDADLASRNAFTDPYEAKLAKLKEEAAAAKAAEKPAYTLPTPAITAPVAPPSPKASAPVAPPSPKASAPVAPPSPKASATPAAPAPPAEAPAVSRPPPPPVPKAAPAPAPVPAPAPSPVPASGGDAPEGDGIDPTRREAALSDAEFQETFKMSKPEFYALPKWKQVKLKKETGYF